MVDYEFLCFCNKRKLDGKMNRNCKSIHKTQKKTRQKTMHNKSCDIYKTAN